MCCIDTCRLIRLQYGMALADRSWYYSKYNRSLARCSVSPIPATVTARKSSSFDWLDLLSSLCSLASTDHAITSLIELSRPALEHKLSSWAPTPYELLVFKNLRTCCSATQGDRSIEGYSHTAF